MMSLIDKLPEGVIAKNILPCVSDPASVCSFMMTCKPAKEIALDPLSQALWLLANSGKPLLAAAEKGSSVEVTRLLLRNGVDANCEEDRFMTALHVAAVKGRCDVARVLLEAGADINRREGSYGKTALHIAAEGGHVGLLRVIFDAVIANNDDEGDSVVDRRDCLSGQTALHCAAMRGNVDAVRILLYDAPHGIDVNRSDHCGETALHRAVFRRHLKVVRTLLDDVRVKANRRNHYGGTALHYAVQKGCVEIACTLLDYVPRVDVNLGDCVGRTALHYAVMRSCFDRGLKRIEMVIALSETHGIDLDSRDVFGKTALHYAAGNKRNEDVRILLAAGARPDVPDDEGELPVSVALRDGNDEVVRILSLDDAASGEHATTR